MDNRLKELMNSGLLSFGQRRGQREKDLSSQPESFPPLLEELSFGAIHEWSLCLPEVNQKNSVWYPPLLVLCALLSEQLKTKLHSSQKKHLWNKNLILWIGKNCWPSPYILERFFSDTALTSEDKNESLASSKTKWDWKRQCIFIDTTKHSSRLLLASHNLRSPSVFAVIVDGSAFSFIDTRKLQLAARKGNTLGLIMRPAQELKRPSSSKTKWLTTPLPSTSTDHAFLITLQKAHGIIEPLQWKFLASDNIYEENSLSILPFSSSRPTEKEDFQDKSRVA